MKMSYVLLGILPVLFMCILYSDQLFGKTIVKSPNDKKAYRSIKLKNGLEVLLISDPQTDSSAASMDVGVGQFQDPADSQGLAHYLEHMLFLGTQKYPVAGEFSDYLSSHGGMSNAYTSFENTNYYFSVHKDSLEPALDRFAQFFISPTFNKEFANREINAVHSEHKKNIKDDGRRLYQVLRSLSNTRHPFSQFGTGNLKSLLNGEKTETLLVDKLKHFYQTHYSADIMKLVVLGKESLDDLEQMVKAQFSEVRKQKHKSRNYQNIKVIRDSLPRMIKVKSIKSLRELKLMFPISSQAVHYRTKPADLIAYLLGDESKGSVLSALKQKGWATSLAAGTSIQTSGFSFFDIGISLTTDGVDHIDDIVHLVFDYINLINSASLVRLQAYYTEIKKVSDIGFRYQEKSIPVTLVNRLAEDMRYIPAEDVVSAKWIFDGYAQTLSENILGRLIPENLQLVLITNQLEGTLEKEKWYGTNYSVESLPVSRVKRWINGIIPDVTLTLPKVNLFIPEKIEIKSMPGPPMKHPVLIEDGSGIKVWFKHDNIFNVPKANLRILLSNKVAYQDPKNAALSNIFSFLLLENLNEYSYPATVAGLRFTVTNLVQGIYITISGYPENIEIILNRIIEEIENFKISPDQFKTFTTQLKERKLNQRHAQAYRQAMYGFYYILSEHLWHFEEYIEVFNQIVEKDLNRFLPSLIQTMDIEVFGHGNILSDDLKRYTTRLKQAFNNQNEMVEVIEERTLMLPEKSDQIFRLKTDDVNSAICLYFQAGERSLKQAVLLDLLQVLIEKPFYHQLRTLEQLGYIVWSGSQELNNVEGFYFVIQSGEKDPDYLHERIESFIRLYFKQLEDLSDEEFQTIVQTLIDKRLEPPKNLLEETKQYWREISSGRYNFNSVKEEVEMLKSVKRGEVLEFYEKVFLSAESRKSLATYAYSKNYEHKKVPYSSMENLKAFKRNAQYYSNFSSLR